MAPGAVRGGPAGGRAGRASARQARRALRAAARGPLSPAGGARRRALHLGRGGGPPEGLRDPRAAQEERRCHRRAIDPGAVFQRARGRMKPLPDAEKLCAGLAGALRPLVGPRTAMIGLYTGGAWLAERLHKMLDIKSPLGLMDIAFYR